VSFALRNSKPLSFQLLVQSARLEMCAMRTHVVGFAAGCSLVVERTCSCTGMVLITVVLAVADSLCS
jgi:hypothetical protein